MLASSHFFVLLVDVVIFIIDVRLLPLATLANKLVKHPSAASWPLVSIDVLLELLTLRLVLLEPGARVALLSLLEHLLLFVSAVLHLDLQPLHLVRVI